MKNPFEAVFADRPGRWMRVVTFFVTAIAIGGLAASAVSGWNEGTESAWAWGVATLWAVFCLFSDLGRWETELEREDLRDKLWATREKVGDLRARAMTAEEKLALNGQPSLD